MNKAATQKLSINDFRHLGGPAIELLRTLHDKHGFHYLHMMSMRIDGKPVTRAHLRLASPCSMFTDTISTPPQSPSIKILKRQICVAHLSYLAGLYVELEPNWKGSLTVDARHLMDSWEIYRASSLPVHAYARRPSAKDGAHFKPPVALRDHWLTVNALSSNIIDLVYCPSCRVPGLRVAEELKSTNWSKLSNLCMWCSVKKRRRVAKPIEQATIHPFPSKVGHESPLEGSVDGPRALKK